MNYKKFSAPASTALMIVIVLTLALAPGARAANKSKLLYAFKGHTDGGDPSGSMIFDQAGNLYGTTQGGGSSGSGTVFELSPNQDGSWTESVLYSFTGGNDGDRPFASLIFDSVGNLYSTTYAGGNDRAGTVFELSQNQDGSWTESVLLSFNFTNGSGPTTGLIFDSTGNLYGSTTEGGEYGDGTIFQLTQNPDGSWTETLLHSFTGGSDGNYPDHGGLVFDTAGNLYGTTYEGGNYGGGTVFELSQNQDGSWTEKVLHQFTGGNNKGAKPESTLIFDKSGDLYGTTLSGGAHGDGNVFELIPNGDGGWTEKVLHEFTGEDGAGPYEGVTFDQAGNLYGTAEKGGDLSGFCAEIAAGISTSQGISRICALVTCSASLNSRMPPSRPEYRWKRSWTGSPFGL